MPSPNHHLRNGADLSPPGAVVHHHHSQFQSTVSAQKLRRLNGLVLLLRFASFCFSFASAVFMATNSSSTPSWIDSDPFRAVFAANAIVALYSFLEMGASICEILKATTVLPESMQLWFDFGHDQVFAYLLVAAEAAAAGEAAALRRRRKEEGVEGGFLVQSEISIVLGFAGFAFLAVAALVSAFRVTCYLITGSRYHL